MFYDRLHGVQIDVTLQWRPWLDNAVRARSLMFLVFFFRPDQQIKGQALR